VAQGAPLDIVIPLFNAASATARCLTHLRAFAPPQANLIVIDNASTDWTPALLWRFAKYGATVIRNEQNGGVYSALNQGIIAGRAPFVLLLNSDVLIGPDTIADLLAAAEQTESLCLSCTEITPPDSIDILYQQQPRRDRGRFALEPALAGAIQLHRRILYETVGLFDERFFLTHGDADLCERLRLAATASGHPDWTPMRATEILVYHDEHSSRRANLNAALDTDLEMADQERFLTKWAAYPEVIERHAPMAREALLEAKREWRWER